MKKPTFTYSHLLNHKIQASVDEQSCSIKHKLLIVAVEIMVMNSKTTKRKASFNNHEP